MLKILDVPTSNISALKKSPTKIFAKAKKAKSGVYVFNRDTPAGIVMDVDDYEHMVRLIDELEEKLFDAEAADRLQTNDKLYSDQEVRGVKARNKQVDLDDDDGWE
ncbi:MAG: type II toxin-antitoxin system Phd/YefM family antitoxin [Lactobacillus sp.]|jgi:antitoxin StbD|nr:type II toxin-antitoxin system Phd/YefM family antitoxin [Lactobacillus sp.]